jgi:2-phosphoglycerate kinase
LIQVDTKVKAQEQILIEETILTMYKNNMYKNDYVNRAKVVVESGIIDYIMNYFSIKRIISRSRNRERAIIAGLCMCDNSNYDRLIDCLKNNKFLMDIRCSEVTFENVDRWLSYMYRR